MGMLQVYDCGRTQTPPEVLPELRDLFSRDPFTAKARPEELAAQLAGNPPPWAVELALEALELEDGEVAA